MAGLIQHHHGRWWMLLGIMFLLIWKCSGCSGVCSGDSEGTETRNAELPENRKMEFRIGVNLGDVIEDGEQILGDGVNIASRLESLSEAGGICISGTAFDQVRISWSLDMIILVNKALRISHYQSVCISLDGA